MPRIGAAVGVVVPRPGFDGMRIHGVWLRRVIVPGRRAVVVLERHALPGSDRQRPLKGNHQGHQDNEEHAGWMLHCSAILRSDADLINIRAFGSLQRTQ